MSSGIFLIRSDEELIEMNEEQYESEALLQKFLEKYPELLAGKQIDSSSPRRWLFISREAGLPSEEGGGSRWAIDHLFIDQDAIPTLIEVKRSSDTRIRREVIGQMLDYAANAVVYWPIESIFSMFEKTCEKKGIEPDQAIFEFLGTDENPEDYWQKVKTNLLAGKLRMIFVADEIPQELQRIVEFLNEQMNPAEVLAVEIKQFVSSDLRTLVPRVIGQTAEAKQKKSGGLESRQWDEESFFGAIASNQDSEIAEVARKLLNWANANMTRIWWGKGKKDGSFIPVLDYVGRDYFPFAVRTGYSKAYIQIQFQPLASRPPFDEEAERLELLRQLNSIPGVDLPEDSISRYPSIYLTVLKDEESAQKFIDAMEWVIKRIKS